jgi:D-alanine-D-alanine ligase
MKIVVLAGGLSPERDVSLSSGSMIANSLMNSGHSVALVDVYTGPGELTKSLFYNKESDKTFFHAVLPIEPDLAALKREVNQGEALIGKNVLELCKSADLCFIALHGGIGENGALQAVLETHGVPFTGTGYTGSLLAMDKDIAKRLMVQSGILTPEWMLFDTENDTIDAFLAQIGIPCAVKPLNCGSSIGVSLIYDTAELAKAIDVAKAYERFVLIEKLITGREFSIGILDGKALPVIEIIPHTGFFDYANKYQGTSDEICPAELDHEIAEALQADALRVHKTLRLGFYSRIDFLLDEEGLHYCLEANTLPGMTPASLFPKEAAAAGIGYDELCERIAAGR